MSDDSNLRRCQECGAVLSHSREFHPYAFCVWLKAGLDPWKTLRWINDQVTRHR